MGRGSYMYYVFLSAAKVSDFVLIIIRIFELKICLISMQMRDIWIFQPVYFHKANTLLGFSSYFLDFRSKDVPLSMWFGPRKGAYNLVYFYMATNQIHDVMGVCLHDLMYSTATSYAKPRSQPNYHEIMRLGMCELSQLTMLSNQYPL